MAPKQPKIHAQPRLTFSALAKLMAPHTPTGLMSILKESKYPKLGPVLNYTNAQRHIVGLIIGSPVAGGVLRPHEQEAVDAFRLNPFRLPVGVAAKRSSTSNPSWQFAGVDISVFPDILLTGLNGTGALKLYFPQQPLAKGVGKTMASLLAHYRSSVLKDSSLLPAYCMVYEVRTNRLHSAGGKTISAGALAKATHACHLACGMWPTL